MATKEANQVQADSQQPSEAQENTAGLTLQDLVTVAQIIQITNQRGAFRAEELQNVGALYNKLIAFLESVGAISRPESVTENTTQETTND